MAFLNEQYKELQGKFSALETSYNNSKTEFESANVKVTALETQVTELNKVKSDLEAKLKVFGENPNVLTELNSKIQTLTQENTQIKAQVETLTKEKTDASTKLTNLEKEMEQKINAKAAEIIANGKVESPLPITADVPNTMDVSAFLEELDKKPTVSAKNEFINNNKSLWREVLKAREKAIKGK